MTAKGSQKGKYKTIKSLFYSSCLKGVVKKEEVREVSLLVYDASSRRYYRVKTDSSSYVVCLDRPFEANSYPFLEIQRFLHGAGIRVPAIYDFDGEKGYLLEEDLGDQTLLNCSAFFDMKKELEVYKSCVDLLIKLQSYPLDTGEHSFKKLSFDSTKLDEEVTFSIEHFLGFLVRGKTTKWQREINDIAGDFKKINKSISEKEMVFAHRDYHSRNIMVKKGELVIIDFQDARLGLPQYDLVSLLDDCYYDLGADNRENIKKYYFSQFSKISIDQKSYADFSYFYDLICMQRVFKALGTFASMFNQRSDERYLKHIAFAFEKLKKIMLKYKEFHHLRKNLAVIYYEN